MTSGTVKFSHEKKGFRFIAPDDSGKDVFVHATAPEQSGLRLLREGRRVSCDTADDPRNGKTGVSTISVES